ncbi:MAG: multiheme c-type cytochrome [Candidatus Eisenbacteria bacterium]
MARSDARLTFAVAALALLASCGGGDRRLLIVTSNDVSGKTSPCGCHTPKGGLARRAAFLDSVRGKRPNVLVLDAGNFFPATDDEAESGPYMLAEMARLGTQAAGVGVNELRFGYSFTREHAASAGVPLVSSNVVRFENGAPAFEPWKLIESGGMKVGVFGLLSENADLGPARDSLRVEPVASAAQKAIATLREQGAQLVVLLSQLGKVESESLAVRVPGIDLVVGGGGVPVLPDGVRAGGAVAVYGGIQGWQVGVVDVTNGAGGPPVLAARTVVLDPSVKNQPAMLARVKAFEDSLNAHLRARDAALGPAPVPGGKTQHYIGMSNCIKCHASQYAQWQTTAHARAWSTLVEQHKESTPACVGCHVVGYGQPGGFRTADDAARFGNVQCESCHGMGTGHRQWIEDGNSVAEATCRGCHTDVTSPAFKLALYRPHVLHDPPPGLQPLPESPAKALMRAGKAPHGH